MHTVIRTLTVVGLSAAAAAALCAGSALHAGDDDDDAGDQAAAKKTADEALVKAVARGKELFNAKEGVKKTCASCHENAEKPNLDLKSRPFSYPAYSKRAKVVVTMQQKINEMMKFNSRGKEFDPVGSDVAAVEAYIVSLKRK